MKLFTKAILFLFCISAINACYGEPVAVSFDRLYSETAASRALRSLRQLLSLVYEGYQKSSAEQIRVAWLNTYNSINKLNPHLVEADLQEYIKSVWLYIDQAHDEIDFDDQAILGFVGEMRKVCECLIRSTKPHQNQGMNILNQH